MSKKTFNKTLKGVVKRHPDGFGFLIPDDTEHPDVYIPKHAMLGVMSNDVVTAVVERSREGKNRYFGENVKLVERRTKTVYGAFAKMSAQFGLLVDHEGAWGSDIYIPMSDNKGAIEGQMVAVELTNKLTQSGHLLGKVIEFLGAIEDPLTDIKRVMIDHQLPFSFSPVAMKEAERLPLEVTRGDFEGREDLTSEKFITIDGVTAKDFDDAILVKPSNKGFQLWVAIADVSHYVKPETAIDEEAYKRGTSTYFPKFVIPMLPEKLSNELCSLKPNVDRLSFVCEMLIGFQGEVQSYKVYEAVIKSKARVTYGEAQEVIDGNAPNKLEHVKENILRAADLAKVLMARRFREGSLDLELPETEIIIDDLGHPLDIIKSDRIFSHRLIEELMLIANVCVARFLHEKGADCLYRIHESPAQDNIDILERFISNFGGKNKIGGGKLQKKLTRVLEDFSGTAQGEALSMLILRSMMQAKYSPENVGHFGLAFSHYAHFTSPIRRYPDLIVHRLLKKFAVGAKKYPGYEYSNLATAGTWLSACEQKSVKAERQFRSIKTARFMTGFMGQEFDSVISSVTKMGIFVLLRQYDVTGLIKMEEIGVRGLELDEQNLRLISPKTGIEYKVGDTLKVTLTQSNIITGKIDFAMSGAVKRAVDYDRKENKPNFKKREPLKTNSRSFGKTRFSKPRRTR